MGNLANLIFDPLGYLRTSKTYSDDDEKSKIKERLEEERSLATKIQFSAYFSTISASSSFFLSS